MSIDLLYSRRLWRSGLFCCLALGSRMLGQVVPPRAAALAELSLQELMDIRIDRVTSASKFEQGTNQAPASVSVVTAEEMTLLGHRSLADVLGGQRGFYILSDRNYANLGVRGFARPGDFNTRILLLTNGHRMNDSLYGSALIGNEALVDPALIERVEIIRGPSASVYGNSAFFGVVNVITRSAAQIDGTELSFGGGSLGTKEGSLRFGRTFSSGVEVVAGGSFLDSDGQRALYFPEFDQPATNHGVAENADAERTRRGFVQVRYRALAFTAGFLERQKYIPTASFGTYFNDGRERSTDQTWMADVSFDHELGQDWTVSARAFYDRYGYRADYPYNWAGPGKKPWVVVSHDDNLGAGAGAELQLTKGVSEWGTFVAGAASRHDLRLLQSNYLDDPKTYTAYSDRSDHSWGVFAQGDVRLRRDVTASAGLRYDRFSTFGGALSPRVGLLYTPWINGTWKALYGTAYRAPNAYESYLDSPGFIKANPNLKPETVRTYELVYEHVFNAAWRGTVSAYEFDADRLLSPTVDARDHLQYFQNADDVRARGLEAEVEFRSAAPVVIRGSFAWQRAIYPQTERELSSMPHVMAKLAALVPLFHGTTHLGVESAYTGEMLTLKGHSSDEFLLTNLTATTRALGRNVELRASLYNVFNQSYALPGSSSHRQEVLPQDGRTLRVRLTLRF